MDVMFSPLQGYVCMFISYQYNTKRCTQVWMKFGLWFAFDPRMNSLHFIHDRDVDLYFGSRLILKLYPNTNICIVIKLRGM